jgi:hypothetical protein
MSVTYGFYNSIKGDRKYNALEMSSIFDGIIVDGVYMSIGDALNVKSSGGMGITVGIGRAWFNHTWTLNDSLLPLTLANSDVLLNRIDAIVLEVNNNTEVRKNTIKILKGTPSSKPVKPTMTEGELLNQHPLAYISIPAGATSISQSNIENAVGTSACPYVTGVLKGMDIDKLVAQWGAQWAEWLSSNTDAWKAFMSDNTNEWKSFMAKNKNEWSALINGNTSEFETWFEHMKDQLSEDAAGNLQLQVDNLNNAALGGDFVLKGSPVSVEYMGANRIASITAYGENAQGGTTEAPVALTGVDNVFVGDNNLLPKATETRTLNGVTFTPNPDGSVSVSGTATNDTSYPFKEGLDDSLFGQTVCLSGGSIQTQLVINEKKHSGEWVRNVIVNAKIPAVVGVLSKQADDNILYGTIYVPTGTTVNKTVYPMLNLGNTAMPYEPYQGSVTQLPIPRPLRRVGDVKDKCVTRQDYESAEKLVVTYNVGFVELDGTENWRLESETNCFLLDRGLLNGKFDHNEATVICDRYKSGTYTNRTTPCVYAYNYGGASLGFADNQYDSVDSWKSYLAAQKEAGTPVQIAYQLATPEVYATDPLDIDNAAGPLTVMTGGELEVRMTELIGSRTYDADGDGVVDKAAAVPWDGVTGKPGAFTPSAHTHDDRYYTETEMNTKLNGKANSSHTHTKDQVGLSKVNNNSISMGLSGTDLWVYYS